MTWNEITDGDPGLALPAMQNWRHAGRFAGNMVPIDTDGSTLTTGLLNLGTEAAPWANAYIATGGSLYVGGVAFEGGGGGAAIEVFEQKSHLDQEGIVLPLSNPESINESFINSDNMVLTLGKIHLNTETTIFLDRDATSISAISAASATAWTPVNTGTTATDTTAGQSVNSTSVKYSVTATDTTYFMAMSFTAFSLADKNIKVWLYPDTVSNIDGARIRLYSAATTTGYAEFQIPAASITAATLNSFYLDLDNPTTSGAAYLRGSINYVQLGLEGTATPQAINWSWNYIRSVSNKNLKVPVQLVCDNSTNQEFINVTTATVAGDEFILDTITSYSHTMSVSEIKLKQLDVASNQGKIASGTTGDAALTGWHISRKYLDTTTSGDLIITSRWYDDNYQVATVTNASTTVITVNTTAVAAGFLSGDVVRLYKYEYIDEEYQSPVNGSIGSNFLDLTLTANAGTTSSTEMTLTHANTSNQNLGGDSASEWQSVRVSIDAYYQVEDASQSQALVKATTSRFIPVSSNILLFLDEFTRANSTTVGNGWSQASGSNGTGTFGIYSNEFWTDIGNANANWRGMAIWRYSAAYKLNTQAIEASGTWVTSWAVAETLNQRFYTFFGNDTGISIIANAYPTSINSLYVAFDSNTAGTAINITIGDKDETLLSDSLTIDYGNASMYFRIQATKDTVRLKLWLTTEDEPTTWQFSATKKVGFVTTNPGYFGCYLGTDGSANNAGGSSRLTDIKFERVGSGFIDKATVSDVSGNKMTVGSRVTRKDASNQDPIINQRNAVIV